MKKIESLKRLQKWQVDQARRRLSELYAQQAEIDRLARDLEVAVVEEQRFAASSEAGTFLYANYIAGIERQREMLAEQRLALEEEIEIARAKASEAYREQKKVDIISERQSERERREKDKRVQQQLDEIAAVRHEK